MLVEVGEKPLDSYSEKVWDIVISAFFENRSRWTGSEGGFVSQLMSPTQPSYVAMGGEGQGGD